MARIFISYKRKNKDAVFGIVKQIESRLGVKCWIDYNGIESATQFRTKICNAIDKAEVLLFMHSSAHLDIDFENDFTIKELNYAHDKKKPIILVKLDDAPLDNVFLFDYGTKDNIDAADSIQLEKMIKNIANRLGVSDKCDVEESNKRAKEKLQIKREAELDIIYDQILDERKKYNDHISLMQKEGLVVSQEYLSSFNEMDDEKFKARIEELETENSRLILDVNNLRKENNMQSKDTVDINARSIQARYKIVIFILMTVIIALLVLCCILLNSNKNKSLSGLGKENNMLSEDSVSVLEMFELGRMYYYGNGVDRDTLEAIRWYRMAAEHGHPVAQNLLGNRYYYGEGVDKDYVEAVKWYRLAAEQGYPEAQNLLGNRYYYGEGVDKDYVEAVRWYRLAAEQGYAGAQRNLGNRYYNGEGVDKDYVEAVRWYHKAAEQGDMYAQFNLGNRYYYGQGVDKDYVEAVKWYHKAAMQGYAHAQFTLANRYYNGQGVDRDYDEALKWYRMAAKQGHAEAKEKLVSLKF